MKREGMVHALRRACRWLVPHGRLIDIHPTSEPARLAIQAGTDLPIAGELQDLTGGCGPAGRHAQADAALAAAVAQGWLALEGRRDVTFRHEAGTVAEIEDHVAVEWRDARFATATLERATALVRAHPHGRVVLLEEITMSRLRPTGSEHRVPYNGSEPDALVTSPHRAHSTRAGGRRSRCHAQS